MTSRIAVAFAENLFRTYEAERSCFITKAELVAFTQHAARLAIEQSNGIEIPKGSPIL